MNSKDTKGQSLQWDVFTSKRPGLSRDLPPGKEDLMWVSNSSTLIYGERDAVLVDTSYILFSFSRKKKMNEYLERAIHQLLRNRKR